MGDGQFMMLAYKKPPNVYFTLKGFFQPVNLMGFSSLNGLFIWI